MRLRLSSRVCIAVLCIAVAGFTVGLAPPSTADQPAPLADANSRSSVVPVPSFNDPVARSGAEALSRDFSLSEGEALRRIRLVQDLPAKRRLFERAQALFPRTFAGAWINHAKGGV